MDKLLDDGTGKAIMARQIPDQHRVSSRLRKHLVTLGIDSTRDYLSWCLDNGFSPTTEKSHLEIHEELNAHRRELQRAKSRAKLHRNPKQLIKQACAGDLHPDAVTRPAWHELCQSIHASKADKSSRESLCGLLLKVNEKTSFLLDSAAFGAHTARYVDALVRLNDRRGQWIRSLEDWRPGSHNRQRQFSSLTRHLLARYSVPLFMDSAWFRSDPGAYHLRDWFIHIASGKNIRTAKCPLPMTKRMAHHFVEAPEQYSIEHAIRWGQVHALGGDRRLTEAVLGTTIGESFEHEEFWAAVLRFLVANPLLDRIHVGPIIDYLQHQKYERREVITGPGRIEIQDPPQPNLTMRGRTPDSLLRQVNAWHRELGRSKAAQGLFFRGSGVKGFAFRAGKGRRNTWKIRELLSGAELVAEGRAMHHCVATYANSCANGRCSIWAMELQTPEGLDKRQTVEVSDHGMIVQCRGKRNRPPTPGEYQILNKWAKSAGLTISNYIRLEH